MSNLLEPPPARPRIHLLGDVQHHEFVETLNWLITHAQIDSATPEWLLCFQSSTGQISQAWVEHWHRDFPLAGIVFILGSWCEGETRSGTPCHGTERCYWYEAIPHLQTLWQTPALARTATLVERIEAGLNRTIPTSNPTIAILSKTAAGRDSLCDAFQNLNCLTIANDVADHPRIQPTAWLVDGEDTHDGWTLSALRECYTRWPSVPGISLLNYPRADEIAQLRTLGVRTVFGKPLLLADLQTWLMRIAG